jgi:hypothetical protein
LTSRCSTRWQTPPAPTLQFIIHGKPPGGDANDKDGRNDNISVSYAALKIAGKVGEVWLIQGDATVYTAFPDTRLASTTDARAFWLNKSLIQFPKIGNGGVFKLYHSARGQIKAARDEAVTGADGSITLDIFGGIVPPDVSTRFKYVAAGVVLQVKNSDAAQLPTLLKSQLVLVQEDAAGLVQNASTAQLPGVLDDLYAAAGRCPTWASALQGGTALQALGTHGAEGVGGAVRTGEGQASDPAAGHLRRRHRRVDGPATAATSVGQYYRYVGGSVRARRRPGAQPGHRPVLHQPGSRLEAQLHRRSGIRRRSSPQAGTATPAPARWRSRPTW